MLVADYIPPLRASCRSRSAPRWPATARAGAHDPRRDALDELGPPRDFSTARYATVCETTPLPWAPGTPIDQRPAATQRIAAAAAEHVRPVRPPVVVEDEIDLCLRWPDVPRAGRDRRAAPYPAVPTLILQGGEDLRTPPEVSARVAAADPGRDPARGPGHRPLHRSATRARAARDGDRCASSRGKSPPKSPCKRVPTGVPAVLGRAGVVRARCRASRACRARSGARVRRAGATLDDLRLVLSPAALATSGGGLRGGCWVDHGRRPSSTTTRPSPA